MKYDRTCPVCSKMFSAREHKATYCNELCKKKAAYRRKFPGGKPRKRDISPAEIDLILACGDAGWSGPQTSNLIIELFGWGRTSKVINAVWRRYADGSGEICRVAASERIPDYRADNDAFLAAVRAAPECPPEGIVKDERPLIATKFTKPLGSLGGSPAGEMASFGD